MGVVFQENLKKDGLIGNVLELLGGKGEVLCCMSVDDLNVEGRGKIV